MFLGVASTLLAFGLLFLFFRMNPKVVRLRATWTRWFSLTIDVEGHDDSST